MTIKDISYLRGYEWDQTISCELAVSRPYPGLSDHFKAPAE